jgi:hypothetical protein
MRRTVFDRVGVLAVVAHFDRAGTTVSGMMDIYPTVSRSCGFDRAGLLIDLLAILTATAARSG